MYTTIYDLIRGEEVKYAKPIILEDGWDWSMKEHIRRSFLYLNSQFETNNEDRDLRPNKNIILAILNVQFRLEGFDVKDIELYINNPDEYYKSFLVKKYHEKWALENGIDTFIDDVVMCYSTYGGILARNTNLSRPEVIDIRSLAFCNQTSILDFPFGIKHKLSQSQLREYGEEYGWGEDSNGATIGIEELITLSKREEDDEITVYEVHGVMPSDWIKGDRAEEFDDEKKDTSQIQIVAFYKKANNDEQGVTLFRNREPKLPFKFLARDEIVGRALGRGGVEELFEPQIWTNWNEIKITEMLEAASKMINLTDDPSIVSKHPSGLKNLTNLEFVQVNGDKRGVWQMDNQPRNLVVFNDAVTRWQEHAQITGSAGEGLLAQDTPAGMPFKLYEAKNIEDKSMHKYRQGKIAVFMDEIYRDWIIPHIGNEIVKDQKFFSELSGDEMVRISEAVATNMVNREVKEKILNGKMIDKEEMEALKQLTLNDFSRNGNRKFFEILKDEIKKEHLDVRTNIAGKQKDLALMTDKLVNVMREFISAPQLRQDPDMVKLLNVILESSGVSPITFGSTPQATAQMMPATNVPQAK